MSVPRKKRRLSTDLQTAVLSIFHTSPTDENASTNDLCHKSVKQARVQLSSRLINLCEDLVCIAKEGGRTALASLESELRDRVYSASELSASLFADDDDESVPPLCVVVDLLQAHSLRASDLDRSVVVQRAVYELLNAEACSCRGVHPGVTALIRALLDESGTAANAFLGQFVSVLFPGSRTMRAGDADARFKLAELTIRVLREQTSNREVHVCRFQAWLRQAVLPTRVAKHAFNGDTSAVRASNISLLTHEVL